jgi:hypothetical protein
MAKFLVHASTLQAQQQILWPVSLTATAAAALAAAVVGTAIASFPQTGLAQWGSYLFCNVIGCGFWDCWLPAH